MPLNEVGQCDRYKARECVRGWAPAWSRSRCKVRVIAARCIPPDHQRRTVSATYTLSSTLVVKKLGHHGIRFNHAGLSVVHLYWRVADP